MLALKTHVCNKLPIFNQSSQLPSTQNAFCGFASRLLFPPAFQWSETFSHPKNITSQFPLSDAKAPKSSALGWGWSF